VRFTPKSHVRGLGPFSLENPQLRIELLVGFWTNLIHPVWLESRTHANASSGTLAMPYALRAFVDFVDEATSITRTWPCKIFIEGQKKESVSMWEMIKHIASLQEVLTGSDHVQKYHEINRDLVLVYLDEPWTLSFTAMEVQVQLAYELPRSF
jgi:hypothetical protein